MNNKYHIIVDIHNVTAEQVQEYRRLFAWMNYCGMVGSSRIAKVDYDGDGNAKAMIKINGEQARDSLGSIDDLVFTFE